MSTIKFFLLIIISMVSLSLSGQVASLSNSPVEVDSPMASAETMYYIFITESKSHKKLFPKLYPIGYVMKEKDDKGKMTRYVLGEFKTMPEAEEALKVVLDSGYAKAKIITR